MWPDGNRTEHRCCPPAAGNTGDTALRQHGRAALSQVRESPVPDGPRRNPMLPSGRHRLLGSASLAAERPNAALTRLICAPRGPPRALGIRPQAVPLAVPVTAPEAAFKPGLPIPTPCAGRAPTTDRRRLPPQSAAETSEGTPGFPNPRPIPRRKPIARVTSD